MTPARHLYAVIAVIHAAIGQAYIGLSYLADDETRVIGELHLRDAAAMLRECADGLESLDIPENIPDVASETSAA